MKKRLHILVYIIVVMMLCSVSLLADLSEGVLRKLTPEEIRQSSLDQLNDDLRDNNGQDNNQLRVYNEIAVDYVEDHTFINKEAFQVAEFSINTIGHPEPYKNVMVMYSGGDTVTWNHAGNISGSAEIIFELIEGSIGYTISRSSTISNSVSASVPYSVKTNSVGVVPIYAYGYKTGGAIKYQWTEYGDTGYRYENIEATLPYRQYSSNYITFGGLYYE